MEELIAQIVRQVLEQLQNSSNTLRVLSAPACAEAGSAGTSSQGAACACVLAERSCENLNKLQQCLGVSSSFIFYEESAHVNAENFHFILPLLTCNDMADLAAGKATNIFAQKTLELLLNGKQVEVLEYEYKNYSNSAPDALYALYEGYEKTLSAYGLAPYKPKKAATLLLREQLVTEHMVLQAQANGVKNISVPAGAIVTALACDTAKELNINIFKRA